MSIAEAAGRAPRVVPFPEHKFKPNAAYGFSFVDETGGHPAKLYELANCALYSAAQLKAEADKSGEPKDFQRVVDTVGIAFFALGTMLGIPRGTIEQCAYGEAPVVKLPRSSGARLGGRFAEIKKALAGQKRDLSRARRRWAALLPTYRKRNLTSAGAVTLGAEPLRILQAILDKADVIALDEREHGQVHLLVTLPDWLLDRATAIAAYDEDDEDTDGGEDNQDLEDDAHSEASLGSCSGIIDQSKYGREGVGLPPDHAYGYQNHPGDLEFDPAHLEASLAGTEAEDQREIAQGNMRDLEDQCEDEGSDAMVHG